MGTMTEDSKRFQTTGKARPPSFVENIAGGDERELAGGRVKQHWGGSCCRKGVYISCGPSSDRKYWRAKCDWLPTGNSAPQHRGSFALPPLRYSRSSRATTECSAGRCVDGEEKQTRPRRARIFRVGPGAEFPRGRFGARGCFRSKRRSLPGASSSQAAATSSRHPTPADRQNNGLHKVRLRFYAAGWFYGRRWESWKGVGRKGGDGCCSDGLDDAPLVWIHLDHSTPPTLESRALRLDMLSSGYRFLGLARMAGLLGFVIS